MPPSHRAELQLLDPELLHQWPLPSDPDGDKSDRGTVLVIAGSRHTPGAALLAGTAALRMGAGRLQIASDAFVTTTLGVVVPEAKVLPYDDEAVLASHIERASAVVVGPGLPRGDEANHLLRAVLDRAASEAVVIVDAAALVALPALPHSLVERRTGQLVLTPNREELGRLVSEECSSPITAAAERFGAVVSSFGTVATWDGRHWSTELGHPVMGTSGSGDVLAGLIGGIAGRTGDAAQAACWGTFGHALAGHELGRRCEPVGILARDLIDAAVAGLAGIHA